MKIFPIKTNYQKIVGTLSIIGVFSIIFFIRESSYMCLYDVWWDVNHCKEAITLPSDAVLFLLLFMIFFPVEIFRQWAKYSIVFMGVSLVLILSLPEAEGKQSAGNVLFFGYLIAATLYLINFLRTKTISPVIKKRLKRFLIITGLIVAFIAVLLVLNGGLYSGGLM